MPYIYVFTDTSEVFVYAPQSSLIANFMVPPGHVDMQGAEHRLREKKILLVDIHHGL